jgi:import inner membrane translocase subunit TIM22
MVNPVAAGFVAGGILARNSGPTGAVGGGLAFAAFSAAIDLFLRREPAECVSVLPRSGILLTSYASDD